MKGKGVSEEEKILGVAAKQVLSDKILGQVCKLVTGDPTNSKNKDPYGRPLTTVWFEGRNINEEMISEGYGIVYGGTGEKKWK
jgi:endonuclease YncB( thermonuclease family)